MFPQVQRDFRDITCRELIISYERCVTARLLTKLRTLANIETGSPIRLSKATPKYSRLISTLQKLSHYYKWSVQSVFTYTQDPARNILQLQGVNCPSPALVNSPKGVHKLSSKLKVKNDNNPNYTSNFNNGNGHHAKNYTPWPLLLTWFNFNPSMDK